MEFDIPQALAPKWTASRRWFASVLLSITINVCSTTARFATEDGIPVFHLRKVEPLQTWACPLHCEDLFGKLEDGPTGAGRKVQNVNISERGEPKSGTGFMMGKATEALAHFCHDLQRAYGWRTCRVEMPLNVVRQLIFEPQLGIDDGEAPCSCVNVDRVTIKFSALTKHSLPVDRHNCPWAHPGGTDDPGTAVCIPANGLSMPENWNALRECVRSSPCPITDDSLQMATLRDPREGAVSTFYFWTRRSPSKLERFRSMDHFFLDILPTLSKWLGVRFLLFEEMLGDQSSVFWYDDATSNPAGWFSQFFSLAGLNAPPALLDETVHAHDEGGFDLGFRVQKLDGHPNGTVSRSYKDEVSADIIEQIDDILCQWLPPAFLDRISVSKRGTDHARERLMFSGR